MQGGEAGPLGVVRMRDRGAKQGHHATASALVHRAIEAMHAVGHDLKEILDDAEPLLGIEPLGEVHRAFDVGEQDGDVLALAFQRRPGPANLVGEVFGRKWRARTSSEVVTGPGSRPVPQR